MSWPSGTLTPEDFGSMSLFPDDNSNQTQEISQIGEQNVVKETVGLYLGKSSNKKHKKLRSDVWGNFEKYTDENGKEWAICNICKVKKNGSSKMGTTHLKNHFNSCSKNKKNEGGGSASGDKPAEDSVMDQQLNRLDSVKMLIEQCFYGPIPKSIEAADLIDAYNEEKEKLRMYFEKLSCRLSLMINTELVESVEYISFAVHFIDDDWKLKKKVISLKCIGGDPIMTILKNVLSEWGIDNKISYMILDGYSCNDVMSSNERENGFSSQGSLLFNGKLFCIRDFFDFISTCYEFIKSIERVIYDRMKEIFNYIEGNENFGIAIDRARSLGKKVTTGVIPTGKDLENMGYNALVERGLGLKEAFFELENMDIEFKSINLPKEEWDGVKISYDIYVLILDEIFDTTANMFSPWVCSTYWTTVELLKLKPFIDETGSFQFIEKYLHCVRDGMKCWYDGNLVLAVAAVLDPRFKMDVVKHWYKKIYGAEYETRLAIFTDYLTRVYNEYAEGTNDFQSSHSGSEETKSSISYEMLDLSGKPCKFSHDHPELHLYLEGIRFPLIRDFNILDWWQSNTQYFPTLVRMARDFLSIQITIPYLNYSDLNAGMNAVQRHDHNSDMVEEAFLCSKRWLKREELE